MLTELLEKLEGQHGISPELGKGVLNTIVEHIKEKFPMVGNMLNGVLGGQAGSATTDNSSNQTNAGTGGESTLQILEDLAKNKLGGMFGR